MDLGIVDYYALYAGSEIVLNPARYLRRPRKESAPSFADRAKWASFPNWCKKAHTIYMGYIFSGQKRIENKNPDYCILTLAQETAHHALIGGYCWIIVLPTGIAVYRGDKIRKDENDPNTYIIHGKRDAYKIDFNNETISNIETGASEPFQRDQLIFVYWNENKESLFSDIGLMNIEVFNLNSAKKYHIMKSLHWFLEGKPGQPPEPYSYIQRTNDDPSTTFIQQSNSQIIETINNDIIETVMNMGSLLGISSEFAREVKFQSGISKMIDLIDTNSIVKQIAFNITKYVNIASDTYYRLKGGPNTKIYIEPILRPQESSERRQELKEAADFINIPEITKEIQKLYFSLFQADFSADEYFKLNKIIEQKGGEQKRDFISDMI